MKKMLFLMLFLLVLGTATVSSQVRIGGNGQPNTAAVLDLNATDGTDNGTKTLALPRVKLTSTTDQLGYTTLLNGMLVYNTTTNPGAGVYYWDTDKWVKISDGSFVEKDSIVGNEVVDATSGRGMVRAGSGTTASPYTLGIADTGIVTTMIKNQAVTLPKLGSAPADSGLFLMSNGSGVIAVRRNSRLRTFPDTLHIRQKGAVTWSLILDTTLHASTLPGSYYNIRVPGMKVGDMCMQINVANNAVLIGEQDKIVAFPLQDGRVSDTNWKIKCYRANF